MPKAGMPKVVTRLHFLGATRMVTGSCFLVQHGLTRVLIDCGLVQGPPELLARNREQFQFDPSELKAVVLTNPHLDHSGLVPRLVSEGFRGRILMTESTKDLLPFVWEDFARMQQPSAGIGTPRGPTEGPPLYMQREVERALSRCEGVAYDAIVNISPSVRLRFRDAGHMVGAGIVELCADNLKIVFSGELGRYGKQSMRNPVRIEETDVLILESTYGDRTHKTLPEVLTELGHLIEKTLAGGGRVLMPVYTAGHAQDILQVLSGLVSNGVVHKPRIYLDSPMASQVTEIYARHLTLLDPEAGRVFSSMVGATGPSMVNFIETASDSRELLQGGPAIILAGYGMCESGRIQDHLTLHIDDPQSCVIFTGYQVEGTLGRMLMDGARQVQIHGKTLAVKAQIYQSYELSGQADQADLLEWVGGFNAEPSVFLVHGEVPQMTSLAEALRGQYGIRAVLPQWREMTLFSSL